MTSNPNGQVLTQVSFGKLKSALFVQFCSGSDTNNYTKSKKATITQDRYKDFGGGQVKSTFSRGHCDLTIVAHFQKRVPNDTCGYYHSIDTP